VSQHVKIKKKKKNRDGVLDKEEIEAVYGVHHPYSQKKSADEEAHQAKADHIVNTVLSIMDKDGDGKVSLTEFLEKGVESLPSFEGLGAEGHHYDVESGEFFISEWEWCVAVREIWLTWTP